MTDLSAALTRVAALHDEWGRYVDRAVHDFASELCSGGGPGQRNAVSDPVLAAVLGRLAGASPLDHLADQWRHAVVMTDSLIGDPQGVAKATGARLRWLGSRNDLRGTQGLVWPHADRIERIIHLVRPMSTEAANKLLADEAAQRFDASRCDACDSPCDQTRDGYCDACRKRRPTWQQLHPGQDFSRPAFATWIIADVERGVIRRPASPHSPVGRQTIHEDDVVA